MGLMKLNLKLKSKSKLKSIPIAIGMKLKQIFLTLTFFLCFSYGYGQEYSVTYENYELDELSVPEEIDLESFNPYPFKRYLLSTDTFGEYKKVENASILYQYLLNIDMINGYGILGLQASDIISKKEYFEMFPKDSNSLYLQKYPISKNFKCYFVKIIFNPKDEEERGWSLEQLFFINVKGRNITNITLLASTNKGGFGGSQDFTLNMGEHFYYTRDELYSDVIVVGDNSALEKPLYQKFKFDDNGYLEITETKD